MHLENNSLPTQKSAYDKCLPNHNLPYRLEKKVARLIKKNRLIYGSDASVKDNIGSFAWGVIDRNNTKATLIKFHAQLHDDEDQINSTRGELFGLLACMRHIQHIKIKFRLKIKTKIKIFIYTDSESSITIAMKKFYLTSKTALDNDSDIKSEVRSIFHQMKNYVSLQFVRSHQDDSKPFHTLSLASKINVMMDHHAKAALEKMLVR